MGSRLLPLLALLGAAGGTQVGFLQYPDTSCSRGDRLPPAPSRMCVKPRSVPGKNLLSWQRRDGKAVSLGLKSSECEGSPAPEPGTTPELEHPFPANAEPHPSSSTQSPTASSLLSTPLPSSLATSSADSKVSPAGLPSGTTAMEHSSVLGTAGGRTQSPTLDTGRIERTGAPSALGTSLVPRPVSSSITTRFLTLSPLLALLPGSTSLKEVAAPTSGHSSTSEGAPRSGPEGSIPDGRTAMGPSDHQDTWEGVSNQARWTSTPEPRSKSTAGVALAQSAASSVVLVEDSRTPAEGGLEGVWLSRAGSWISQESKTSPHMVEIHHTPLAPTWTATKSIIDSASMGSSTPPENLGPEGEAATARILSMQLTPSHDRSSNSLLVTGLDLPSQQPGDSQAHVQLEVAPGLDPEAGPTEPEFAVLPLSSGTALTQTPVGMVHMPEVTEEAAVSDSTGGSTTAALDSHISTLRQGTRTVEEALPSVATPNQGVDGIEVAPHSSTSTSLGATVGLGNSTAHPSGSNHGSSPTPELGLPTSYVGPARHPADSTEKPAALSPGQDVSLARTTHQHPTDLPLVSGTGLLWTVVLQGSPAIAAGESWSSQETPGASEPFSMWSAPSSPGPTTFPLQGALSGPAHSLAEIWAGPAESGWRMPADSKKEAQNVPASHTEQPGRGGSTSETDPCLTSQSATDGTSVGAASEKVQPPVSQTPGNHEGANQASHLTGSPTGSETTLLSTKGVRLNLVHSAHDPEFVASQAAALPTSAAPTSETAAAAASNRLWWTLRKGSPVAGPRQREWKRHPNAPTESSVMKTPAPSPHSGGPVQATATLGPLESSWHTWPPVSAPDSGSGSRSGPAIASTWLLAPVPEETPTQPASSVLDDARFRGRRVFVAENQPPLLKAAFLHVPCELVLAMEFSRSLQNPQSSEYQGLVLSINDTITPLLASLPGFQRLEVKTIRPGSVVVEFDALFRAEASGLWMALNRSWLMERLPPGLRVANARVLRSVMLERPPDLCTLLFSCHVGYECIAGEDGDAICTSLCHRDYCQNHGICTHEANHIPICQCPVGSDFWFLGMRCNYKVTQQGLLGVTCGLLLSLVVVGTAIASLVIRRVRMLLLEARADQTKSSYRRFCRLDDVSAHYWSEPWLASASSLDNPAFSNSEELLHLQILDSNYCGCQEDCVAPNGSCKHLQDTPCISAAGRPSSHYNWDTSSTSVNDPMIDSGKASEVSVSSWPLEPIQWSPFPALHKLSGQQANQSQRPHSYCEGMELVNLERSWTA